MSGKYTTIALTLLVLSIAALAINVTVIQKEQTRTTSAQVSTSQCTNDGGITWPTASCPPGYTPGDQIVTDGSTGSSSGSRVSLFRLFFGGDTRTGGDTTTGDGDSQTTGQTCCVPLSDPNLTPTPDLTTTPTPTPTPPPCPACEAPTVLPIVGDPLERPSCNLKCNFEYLQSGDACFAHGELVRLRLKNDGCITYDFGGIEETLCGVAGEILEFRATRKGNVVIKMQCDGLTPTPVLSGSGDSRVIGDGGDTQQSGDSSTTELDTSCYKATIVQCDALTPTPTPSPAIPVGTTTPTLTPVPGDPTLTPGPSCRIPIPRIEFDCPFGCTKAQ